MIYYIYAHVSICLSHQLHYELQWVAVDAIAIIMWRFNEYMHLHLCVYIYICLFCCVHRHPLSSVPPALPCYTESVSSVPPRCLAILNRWVYNRYWWQECSFFIRSAYIRWIPIKKIVWLKFCLTIFGSRRIGARDLQGLDAPVECAWGGSELILNCFFVSSFFWNSVHEVAIDEGVACSHRLAKLQIYVCMQWMRCSGVIVAQWCPGCPGEVCYTGAQLSKAPFGRL